ncbi:hypothetical protein [Corynebacterium diphtheriae]
MSSFLAQMENPFWTATVAPSGGDAPHRAALSSTALNLGVLHLAKQRG